MGSLYLVGELKNALPQNLRLLNQIASIIKKEYYSSFQKSSEESLKESLKRVNEFLAEELKKENVSWLGNLSLAIASLKGLDLNFTKVGNLKVFLSRGSQITDISKNLEFQEIEPYPLKVFSNIVSGKLAKDDKILILTKEAFEFFSLENLLTKIAKTDFLDEKKLKEILKPEERDFLKISGICLLIILTEEALPKKDIVFERKIPEFSIWQALSPVTNRIKSALKILRERVKLNLKKFLKLPAIKIPVKIPKIVFPKIPSLRRNLILILVLAFFLVVGFFLFKAEKEASIRLAREVLEEAEAEKIRAESFLIFKDERQANILLQEARKRVLPQTKIGAPLREEANLLKNQLRKSWLL